MFAQLMGLKTIAPEALHRQSQQPGSVSIYDVNSPQSFDKARVPNAKNIDPAAYAEQDLPADKQAPLVFYCSNPLCRKAPNAARRAKKIGYTDVRAMSAGITGWLAAKLPTESGESSP
jgi:rhodanese-related sulfurtransferase